MKNETFLFWLLKSRSFFFLIFVALFWSAPELKNTGLFCVEWRELYRDEEERETVNSLKQIEKSLFEISRVWNSHSLKYSLPIKFFVLWAVNFITFVTLFPLLLESNSILGLFYFILLQMQTLLLTRFSKADSEWAKYHDDPFYWILCVDVRVDDRYSY